MKLTVASSLLLLLFPSAFGLPQTLTNAQESSNENDLSSRDWPQFRGHNSSGVSPASDLPTEFGVDKNQRWSVALGPGHSSPVIVDEQIFLTSFDVEQSELHVHALSTTDGQDNWKYTVSVESLERGHPSFNPASSTVACDGQRVVAYFGSYGLICLSVSGDLLWDKRMPLTKSYAGNATSPTIIDDQVILYRGNHVDHFLLALNKHTGEQNWRVDQDEPFASELACTACPIRHGDMLIVHTARSVQAFELRTGKRIWVAKCATTATSTPILCDGQVIVAAWNKMGEPALRPPFPSFEVLIGEHDANENGLIERKELPRMMIFHRPDGAEAPQNGASLRFDQTDSNRDGSIDREEWSRQVEGLERFRAGYQSHGLLAIALDGSGIVAPETVRILEEQGIPEVPSPLVDSGLVYMVKNGGVLTVVELSTGKRLTRIRTGGKGTHYASPVAADGKLYCASGDGTIAVLRLGKRPKVLALNEMPAETYATPAIAGDTIYVRTHRGLHAFGKLESSR